MTTKNVKNSLDRIARSLSSTLDSREFLLKNTREIVNLCGKSIILAHKGDMSEAKNNLKRAEELLIKYRKKTNEDLQRYIITSEQEFVEASVLIAIITKIEIPTDRTLKVSSESYVLGLLDCIGELKRLVLDKIRIGDIAEAKRIFEIMENLFMYLYPFALYDKVVKESRRKLDVARILVDDVRMVITEEIRRLDLMKTLEEFRK